MLFTFAGLLAEGVPLGPVQMLVPPSALRGWRLSVLVELRQGGEWGGRPAPVTAAGLLLQLLSRDPSAVRRNIAPRLVLDSRTSLSERLRGAQERDDRWLLTIKDYRNIHKALSMELLCGSLLAHLDDPGGVVSLCCSDRGQPYNFAPAGLPDLTAEHDPSIRLVAEVSAKPDASAEFQRSQLDQALQHAQGELDAGGVDAVYALVVNLGDFGSVPELQSQYASFVAEKGLVADGPIRVVPMSGKDLASVLMNLSERHPEDGMLFSSDALLHGFNQIINGFLQPEPPSTPAGWRSCWCAALGATGGGAGVRRPRRAAGLVHSGRRSSLQSLRGVRS